MKRQRRRESGGHHEHSSSVPVLWSGSTAELQQPNPLRPAPAAILSTSSEFEIAESILAQVHSSVLQISPSRQHQNDEWKSLVNLSESDRNWAGHSNNLPTAQEMISPGVSGLLKLRRTTPVPEPDDNGFILRTSEYDGSLSGNESAVSGSLAPSPRESLADADSGQNPHPNKPTSSRPDGYPKDTRSYEARSHELEPTCPHSRALINNLASLSTNASEDEVKRSDDDIATEDSCEPFVTESSQMVKAIPTKDIEARPPTKPAITARNTKTIGPIVSQEDANEAWKRFVLTDDESDEIAEAALFEAKHEALPELYQSYSSLGNTDHQPGAWGQAAHTEMATHGSISSDFMGNIASASEVGASDHATFGPTFSSIAPTDQTWGTLKSGHMSRSDQPTGIGTTVSRVTEDISSALSSDPVSVLVMPPESQVGEGNQESFRFAPPKPFIGKRADSARPRRESLRRRPDIRKLQAYRGGDAIEEFEEVGPFRGPQRSLFGSLETE